MRKGKNVQQRVFLGVQGARPHRKNTLLSAPSSALFEVAGPSPRCLLTHPHTPPEPHGVLILKNPNGRLLFRLE